MTLRLTISAESVRDAMPPERTLLDAAARIVRKETSQLCR